MLKTISYDEVSKNDLRLKSSTYRNNVDVDLFDKHKNSIQTIKTWVKIIEIKVKNAFAAVITWCTIARARLPYTEQYA